MRNDKYIAVKVNIQKILLVALVFFSITLIFLFNSQKKEMNSLKSKSSGQNVLIQDLKSQVNDLEYDKSNLEDQINDLEGRIDDLESRRIVITYQ